jgi:LemA protein
MRGPRPSVERQVGYTSIMEVLLILVAGTLLIWAVVIFNRLVRSGNLVRAGFADIDVQLQRRHDLVPQLVETVRAYASFEQRVLEEVTALRTSARDAEQGGQPELIAGAEAALVAGLGKLMVLAEDYPDLKADRNFRQLMADLVDTENQLSHARRFYNGAVRQLNTLVQQFPDLLVARLSGFREAAYFSAEIEARSAPGMAALLNDQVQS